MQEIFFALEKIKKETNADHVQFVVGHVMDEWVGKLGGDNCSAAFTVQFCCTHEDEYYKYVEHFTTDSILRSEMVDEFITKVNKYLSVQFKQPPALKVVK